MSPLTAAQRAVVTDLGANFCVTSGAGCGKTRVLVERYIHFLEQDLSLPLERLAAMTFTQNAAAEMRDRIRQACRAQVDAARRAKDAARMKTWLQRYWDVDIAPIDTIHGFASALLRRYPIEAGVDPNFTLLDEAEATFLRMDVVAAAIEQLLQDEDADLLAVLEHFGLTTAREMLSEIVSEKREVLQRVAAPIMQRTDQAILADLRKAVEERTLEGLRHVAEGPAVVEAARVLRAASGSPGDKCEQVRAEAVAALDRLCRARTADVARAAATALAQGINLRGGSAKQWPSAEALAAAKAALRTVRDEVRKALDALPDFEDPAEQAHLALARALYRTASRLIEAYQAAKREQSALDFEDLQILARDLLRADADVLRQCRARFRAILVDELQDTNLLQFEIVDLLTSGAPGRRKEPPLRPGALFGVGDPKQSIYRFRGAEVEVFDRAVGRVGPGGRKGLRESFRLHTGTAALVNHLFAGLMGGAYEPIEGKRKQTNTHVGEFQIIVPPEGHRLDAATGYAAEAQRLAARLREIVEQQAVTVQDEAAGIVRPARYGDIAVLLRRTTYLHVYEEALERQGIPYYVVAGRGFYKQQEVLDVIHLLRVLDDPRDDLHLAGVLRSPFFAVSDEGLYHLRQAGPSLHEAMAAAATAADVHPEDLRGLRRAARLLPQWTALKDRLGLGALVEAVAFDSGYAAASVGRFGGARAYANLRQMAELARRFEQRGLSALGDYIGYVTDFMESEMREEQASVDAPGGQTVRLMTIHKAKGLEFPVVVVPDLGYAPQGSRAEYFIQPVTGLAVRMRDEEGDRRTSCALALARRDDAAAEEAEQHRLLYVAMTRSKDYLIFSSHLPYTAARPTWLDRLMGGIRATAEPGERVIGLPTGETMQFAAQPPPQEPGSRGARRVGPRDVFAGGRVRWDRLGDRAAGSRQEGARTVAQVVQEPAAPRPPLRVTATSLETYRRCPRLYWWTEVLGIDQPEPPQGGADLSARQWGVVSHRALELCGGPAPAQVRAAVEGALRLLPDGPGPRRDDLRRRLTGTVEAFWASPLGQRVAQARAVYREIPFLLLLDNVEIRGTIDLVFESSDGCWDLVDYKSSSPSGAAAEEAAASYDLQLGLYATAAGRWLGHPIARWWVFFLGSAAAVEHPVARTDPETVAQETRGLLAHIATGRYDSGRSRQCLHCRCRTLCSEGPVPGPATTSMGGRS